MNKEPLLEVEKDENDSDCSEEELTSYQVPRNDDKPKDITPSNSPLNLRFPSSLISSRISISAPVQYLFEKEYLEENNYRSTAPDVLQRSAFKALGMSEKNISWASSMESLVAEVEPRSEFNTIERATFFPNSRLRKFFCSINNIF